MWHASSRSGPSIGSASPVTTEIPATLGMTAPVGIPQDELVCADLPTPVSKKRITAGWVAYPQRSTASYLIALRYMDSTAD